MTGHYQNGNIGIEIWSDTEGPITKVTVNPDIIVSSDCIAIKNYSENEGMVDWLISMKVIEETPVKIIGSGFVQIPIHRLTKRGNELLGIE